MIYTCKMLGGIEQQGGTAAQKRTGVGGDDGAVVQFHGGGGVATALQKGVGGHGRTAVVRRDAGLVEQHLDLAHLILVACTVGQLVGGIIITTDNLVFRSLAANRIVADAEAHHVHTHVGRRFIRALTINALKQSLQHWENLYVAVVVHSHLSVGFQMERVNHVHVVQVGCGSLIGDVHRMLQRKAPHREGLKLGIAGVNTPLVLAIELAQTNRHLSAARTGSGHNHQRAGGLHIVVLAKALVGGNLCHIMWIAFDQIVDVRLDAHTLQAMTEGIGRTLTVVMGDDHRTDHETTVHKLIAQAQHILVVSDTQVGTHLVLLDVFSTDHDHNLNAVAQLAEHPQLAVGLEARQHAGGVMVVKEFATKLQVQLTVKL